MTSEYRSASQCPINKLYVNTGPIQSSITDENLSTLSWVTNATALGQLSTSGKAVLRDMGKTVYLPAGSTAATVSTVLRKVQLITNAPLGNGTADGSNYYTGYIQLGGITYGGGNGVPTPDVVRLN